MKMKFEGKTALVTGGCRGIGKAIVEKLAGEGARVYAVDFVIPAEDEVFIENAEIRDRVFVLQADVSSEESVGKAFGNAIRESDSIDILVNNAGITRDNLMMRMNIEQWESVIDTNLKGVFLCTKAILRTMMGQRSGRIINIGSIVGSIGNAGQVNYSASKAGIIGFTKSIAKEVGSRNILANVVAPGYVHTPMTDKLNDEQKEEFLKNIPLRRPAEPEDIASLVSFLASDDASYITGQVIHIDGGLAM